MDKNDIKYLQNKLEGAIKIIDALQKEVDHITSELKALSNYFTESDE